MPAFIPPAVFLVRLGGALKDDGGFSAVFDLRVLGPVQISYDGPPVDGDSGIILFVTQFS